MPQAPLADRLLAWYDVHARRLPWRSPPGSPRPEPYRVWLSEIMLQQTVAATVGPYFARFLERWPSVAALAAAPLDEVLAAWAGLGYYARARNLHACAREVASRHGGHFPEDEAGLAALPGIGPYTAAAIAAIAFDRPATVVDGNVERVMARLHAVREPLPESKPRLRQLAAAIAPADRAGDYAQAVMDLGATICTPRSPACALCPWRDACAARRLGLAEGLPARVAKPARPTRRGVAFWTVRPDGAVLLRRRPERGLLGGMMEIPSTPWRDAPWNSADAAALAPAPLPWRPLPGMIEHVFTHFRLELSVMTARAGQGETIAGTWCPPEALATQALPSVMRKVVRLAAGAALAAGLMLAGVPIRAQAPPQKPPAAPAAPPTQMGGEELYVPELKGWAVGYDQRRGDTDTVEIVPAGQTIQDWNEMLTVVTFDDPPNKSPQDVLAERAGEYRQECDDGGAGPVTPGIENGYGTALGSVICTRSKRQGKGEVSLFKVLRGRDRLYIVARSWRGTPFEKGHLPLTAAQTSEWVAFMNRVAVCDTRDPGRPCPQPPTGN